ncbi:MAG TPA: tryptophan synthase subunit alpha [Pelomicrobium sp.]|nr:tryptophan synthase subunit alpha [Pelomicrobium sp.]
MSRIHSTFQRLRHEGRAALIPFITAGDPDPVSTVPLMHALVRAGVDVIELGVPFSDPMADGPTIQRASERALKRGTTLRQVLQMVREFREQDAATPVVLMGYANPIEAMGYDAFVREAQASGVDGVLVVDYPPEESEAFVGHLAASGIDPIFLLSPTAPEERVRKVGALARGYVYYVSLKGVTGASHLNVEDVRDRVAAMREHIRVPIGVGFGIRDAQTAAAVSRAADAVVVGSRIVEEIEHAPEGEAPERVRRLVAGLRHAMDEAALAGGTRRELA